MPIINKAPIILQRKLQEEGYEVIKNGWPDFLAIKDGKLRFIEAKESWDKLSKEQIKMMQTLTDNGFSCLIWYPHKGLIEFKDYLNSPPKKIERKIKGEKQKEIKKRIKEEKQKEKIKIHMERYPLFTTMNPNEIRAELIRRGITISSLARMIKTSRQNVSMAIISGKGRWGKQAKILSKIEELIGQKINRT